LKDEIARLQSELASAQQSGDQVTHELREQLKQVQSELNDTRQKAQKDYE